MSDNKSNSSKSFEKGLGENTDKIAQLKRYIHQSECIEGVINLANVQFVSANINVWNDSSLVPDKDQLKLF